MGSGASSQNPPSRRFHEPHLAFRNPFDDYPSQAWFLYLHLISLTDIQIGGTVEGGGQEHRPELDSRLLPYWVLW